MATPPHNLVTIDEFKLQGSELYVQMAKSTADSLGVKQGGKVKVSSDAGEIEALVNLNESVMPGVVAAPMNLGHTAWDRFAGGKGDNVYKVLAVSAEEGTGVPTWDSTRVTVAKI
jgi:anaerobic selenocysteine-containing dehydrogenase